MATRLTESEISTSPTASSAFIQSLLGYFSSVILAYLVFFKHAGSLQGLCIRWLVCLERFYQGTHPTHSLQANVQCHRLTEAFADPPPPILHCFDS